MPVCMTVAVCVCLPRVACAAGAVEGFDTAASWYGGDMDTYTPKYYTNAATAAVNGRFSSDLGKRHTVTPYTPPYAWEIAQGLHYFRFECNTVVSNFRMQLRRGAGPQDPDIQIRYSYNSGATYVNLYTGTWLTQSDQVYTQYVSPQLVITPFPGQHVYIEVNKSLGAALLIDDFAFNAAVVESNAAALVYPAPAVSNITGQFREFSTISFADGVAHIGYGRTSNNVEWTWLPAVPANAAPFFGATNQWWLTSGRWYYAARWLRNNNTVTNYAWNAQGQINATTLAAEYFAIVTNSCHSTVWDFGMPGVLTPTQGPAGSIASVYELATNWPGNRTLELSGFSTGTVRTLATNVMFMTSMSGKANVAFYLCVRRDASGPRRLDVQYTNATTAGWVDFVTNYFLEAPDSWYMVGGACSAFDLQSQLGFRVTAYAAGAAGGTLQLDEVVVHSPVPEPVNVVIGAVCAGLWPRRNARGCFSPRGVL